MCDSPGGATGQATRRVGDADGRHDPDCGGGRGVDVQRSMREDLSRHQPQGPLWLRHLCVHAE